jgi:hypothetical protein
MGRNGYLKSRLSSGGHRNGNDGWRRKRHPRDLSITSKTSDSLTRLGIRLVTLRPIYMN